VGPVRWELWLRVRYSKILHTTPTRVAGRWDQLPVSSSLISSAFLTLEVQSKCCVVNSVSWRVALLFGRDVLLTINPGC